MDSGNSGSMQSSSTGGGGGDEEYDSRVESSFSAFLNNAPTQQPRHVNVIPFTNSTLTTNNVSNPHHMLDPFSNYLDPNPIQRSHPIPNSSSLVNLNNMVWSKPASRSELPNLGNLIPCNSISSSSSSQNQQQQHGSVGLATFSTTHHSSLPLLSDDQAHNHNHNKNMVNRNPKKRSRASRRAPTTVLTTDTTNFRAMVQEFTGIPAQPFTSSPFSRTRLDLFGSSSNTTPSSQSQQQPPYLLRPFPQKLHPFPPNSSTSSSIPSMLDNNTLPSINHSTNNLSTNHLGLNMMMNNMHNNNQILSFQSMILQGQAPQNTKYPSLGNSNVLVPSKTTQPSLEIPNTVDSHRVLEELGFSHAHVNTTAHVSGLHHNMVSSSGAVLSRVNNNNNKNNIMRNPSSEDWWVQRTNNNDGDDHGNYNNNIHGEKGPECGVAARSEGMVESWINCSSH